MERISKVGINFCRILLLAKYLSTTHREEILREGKGGNRGGWVISDWNT
jgi:hypothetical protein